jgi:hypothetical protein
MAKFVNVAIDPLALLLSEEIYVRLTLPDPSPIEQGQIREAIQAMGPEEKRVTLARARALGAYVSALEKEISKG